MKNKLFSIILGAILILSAIGSPITAQAFPPSRESPTATPSFISLANQIGGGTYSVTIQGNYAYMGIGPRLAILDITNPTNPSPIGQTEVISNYITDIEISGNYAYVTEKHLADWSGGGLRVIDISNPTQPHSIGFYDTPGDALNLAVSGNYAYIADDYQGLRVVDISDPSLPVEVTTVMPNTSAGSTKNVVIANQRAYVAESYDHGLRILDISDPTNPVTLGRYADRAVHGVAVAGNYAYLACTGTPTGGLSVVNISNPATPQEISFYEAETYSSWVQVQGNYVYLSTQGQTGSLSPRNAYLHIVNIANPAAPTQSGLFFLPYEDSTFTSSRAYQFALTANQVYFAAGMNGLKIMDVANPATPVTVGGYNVPTRPGAIATTGNYLYVADEHWTIYANNYDVGDLHIMDIANPTEPHTVGIYDTQGVIDSLAVSGQHVFVGKYSRFDGSTYEASEGGMQILNISDPAHPVETGFYDSGKRTVNAIALQGNYAYLNAGDGGLGKTHFVDISNLTNPQYAGEYVGESNYMAYDIGVSGDYAYLVRYDLDIINIATPATPIHIGNYEARSALQAVVVSGEYAYTGDNRLLILNIADPTAPTLTGSLSVGDSLNSNLIYDLVVADGYAYLAVANSGLHVVNIVDPQNPVEVAHYPIPGTLNSVAVVGNTVYVTAETAGIYIFSVTPPSTISGQVTDAKGTPIIGAVIAANTLYTATTDASGVYTLTNIPAGNYTLTPAKDGILWWEPAQRSVTTPPSITRQDFVGHHIRKTVTATGEKVVRTGDILTYTITLAYPGPATVSLFDPISHYTDYITDSLQAPAGVSFDVQTHAVTGTVSLPDSNPIEITFAVEVQVSGSIGFAPGITNRAFLCLPGQTLLECEGSNTVSNPTYLWFTYLPFVVRK